MVEILQRVQRMLSEMIRHDWLTFAPYLHGLPGWYVYRLKKEEFASHTEQVGRVMQRLLEELKAGYGKCKEYQMLVRVFDEHFRVVEEEKVTPKTRKNSARVVCDLPADWEATFRNKGNSPHQGYVANLSETSIRTILFN